MQRGFHAIFTALEISDGGGNHIVIAGVEVIEDRFRQTVVFRHCVQQTIQAFRKVRLIANGIKATVNADFFEHWRVVVANRAKVNLHCPVALFVHFG